MDGLTQYLAMENGAVTRQMKMLVAEKAEIQRALALRLRLVENQSTIIEQLNEEVAENATNMFHMEELFVIQEVNLHTSMVQKYDLLTELEKEVKNKRILEVELKDLRAFKEHAQKRMKKMEAEILDRED